ncbi:unnamed protein product [Colias eurytheme]|nr:unnamed protein product [Colias eurytheme]
MGTHIYFLNAKWLSIWATLSVLITVNTASAERNARFLFDDVKLNTTELAAKYGYKVEEHKVTTEDGYVLTIHHIPGKGRPILMIHALADSTESWFTRGEISLGVTLADLGHDLWMGDCRGNAYSRNHVKLDPDKDAEAFWDFSFHEHGYYDLPAFIDTVLEKTGEKKLNAIGISQGTAMFFIMGSLRPEYNEKVNALVAMAPVAYLNHLEPPLSTFIKIAPQLYAAATKLGLYEVLGNTPSGKIIKSICLKPLIGYFICAFGVLFPIAGFDIEEYGPVFHYKAMKRFPQSSSSKNFYHFAQVSRRRSFSQYDYGPSENLEIYGSDMPPDYDLSKVTMPIVLLCGQNDKFSPLEDVATLRVQLPNVVEYTVLERSKMNHLDFVWGKNMDKYLYPELFKAMDKFF